MARGRMLNATVATDKRLAELSLESELLFIKTLPHLDRDGLIIGDASVLWAQVCPRRPELLAITEEAIVQWIDAGLVVAYETDNGRALWFVNFAKNQAGFRYDREPESTIACPPGHIRTAGGIAPDGEVQTSGEHPEECRQTSGKHPANIPLKRREVKENRIGREEKRSAHARTSTPPPLPPAAQVFVDNGGKWASGKLADGSTKKARAITTIAETVGDDPDNLVLWGRVVAAYCLQWSGHSYTTMLDYFRDRRIPGTTARGNGHGPPRENPGLTAVRLAMEEDARNGHS